jgi:hypothetical protein
MKTSPFLVGTVFLALVACNSESSGPATSDGGRLGVSCKCVFQTDGGSVNEPCLGPLTGCASGYLCYTSTCVPLCGSGPDAGSCPPQHECRGGLIVGSDNPHTACVPPVR